MIKPSYRVPTMTDIAALPYQGCDVVSTFSGCGGSSLGYRMAGARVLAACEFVNAAQETYRANFPTTPILTDDIRNICAQDILDTAGISIGELDILDGSPPCSSFSTSGKRDKQWGQVKDYSGGLAQRTDDLFFEFLRLVDGIRPRVVIAENVPGLVIGKAVTYFNLIMGRLQTLGYSPAAQVLEAQWLGVPQTRRRLIIIATRNDLRTTPQFPTPLQYRYTGRDALGGDTLGVTDHIDHETGQNLTLSTGTGMRRLWETMQPGQRPQGKRFNLIRSHPDRPVPTITASAAHGGDGPMHWSEPRRWSLAELRRITSFPDDFQLTGSYVDRAERLGRAVPPVMMRAIASTVIARNLTHQVA